MLKKSIKKNPERWKRLGESTFLFAIARTLSEELEDAEVGVYLLVHLLDVAVVVEKALDEYFVVLAAARL